MVDETKESWLMKIDRTDGAPCSITSFGPSDILIDKAKESHIVDLLGGKFGKGSKKLRDAAYISKVIEEHNEIKEKVRSEATAIVTELFCTMATICGIDSKEGGKFEFRHIAEHVSRNFSLESWIKFFFTIRASWDGSPTWLLIAEEILMRKLCYEYEEGFQSGLKSLGWVAKIISQTKSRRLRELNGNLGRRTGYKLSITNISDKKGRRALYRFYAHSMIVRDDKLRAETEYEVETIKHECGEKGICLLSANTTLIPSGSFVAATKAFTDLNKDYSKVIKTKKSPSCITPKTPELRKSPRLQEAKEILEKKHDTKKKLIITKHDMTEKRVMSPDSIDTFDDVFGIIGHNDNVDLSYESPSVASNINDEKAIKTMEKHFEVVEKKKKEEEEEKKRNVLEKVCTLVC